MGKRLRSIGIRWTESEDDVRITRHAITRFQIRVASMPANAVCIAIRDILKTAVPVVRETGINDRIYLAHRDCVLVMTRSGVITTVLPAKQERFVSSIKSIRKRKNTIKRKPRRWKPPQT